MENTRKMVLVPEAQFNSFTTRKDAVFTPSAVRQAVNLDQEMEQHLNQPVTDPYRQFMEFQQLYQSYLNAKRNSPNRFVQQASINESVQNSSVTEMDAQIIIDHLPQKVQSGAMKIMGIIKKAPEILRWNEKGNIIYKGQQIEGSNISDLLNDVLVRRKSFTPQGQASFLDALNDMNVPESLLSNTDRRADLRKVKYVNYAIPSPQPQTINMPRLERELYTLNNPLKTVNKQKRAAQRKKKPYNTGTQVDEDGWLEY